MPSSPTETRASLILRLPNPADVAAWDELVSVYGASHPEVRKLDLEIRAIEESTRRQKAASGTFASSSVSTSDGQTLNQAPTESAESAATDSELDGTWEVERTIHDGREHLVATDYVYYRWRFNTKARTVSTEWENKSGQSHAGDNNFTLDQTASPKHLTTYGERILLQAIYELKGDRLRIALFGRSEVERPKAFDAKSRNDAGPLVVFEFQRALIQVPDAAGSEKH